MGTWRRCAAALAMVALVGLAAPAPVTAGTNGQQLTFICSGGLRNVDVRGYNQNGDYVTWHGDAGYASRITTIGWWWKGNVMVTFFSVRRNDTFTKFNVYVPPVWPSDIIEASCDV